MTFKEAADRFGVSIKTISNWVKRGVLIEGPAMGRAKTVTLASIEDKESDEAFLRGLDISRGTRIVKPRDSVETDEIKRWLSQELDRRFDKLYREIAEVKSLMKIKSDLPSLPASHHEVHGNSMNFKEIHESSRKMAKPPKRLAIDGDVESKAQFIIKVSEAAGQAFGKNSRCNPFSLSNIDPSSRNITSKLKKGYRSIQKIDQVCSRIFEVNREVNLFPNLSFDHVEIDTQRVAEVESSR